MPKSDILARKEREKFEHKQQQRLKASEIKDGGENWKLSKFFEECK